MGYTLRIGELKATAQQDGLRTYIDFNVDVVSHKQAPKFGEPRDNENQRWPSYTSWANAMKFVGLYELMFEDETGLIREHPGCFPLVKEHKEIIDAAYKSFYEKYPSCKPGYSEAEKWPQENGYATRLEWLKYWVDWALENCTTPVFYNS